MDRGFHTTVLPVRMTGVTLSQSSLPAPQSITHLGTKNKITCINQSTTTDTTRRITTKNLEKKNNNNENKVMFLRRSSSKS